jgi:hypothetical protein
MNYRFYYLVNKFGGDQLIRSDEGTRQSEVGLSSNAAATTAVVTLNVSIEGDSTFSVLQRQQNGGTVRSRQDLLVILSRIATDVPMGECLLSGEVLWAPSTAAEVMTRDDLYVNYPNLITL